MSQKHTPLIETESRFKFHESGDTIVILDIWIDSDGTTQIRINENFSQKRTITKGDLRDRLTAESNSKQISAWTNDDPEYINR